MTKIIAYYMQGNVLYSSTGAMKTEPPYIDCLLADSHPYTIQAFYNLDHAVSRLCKKLSEDEVKTLWSTGVLIKPPYKIKYIPKSMLTIDKGEGQGRQFTTISDMTQYMEAPIVPNLTDDQIKEKLKSAVKVAWDVYNAMRKLNLNPKTIVNPVRTLQNDVLDKLNLSTIDNLPYEAGEYAYNCSIGGWVETIKRGWFPKVNDWDMNGAYADQLRKLVSFDEGLGAWEKVTALPSDRTEGMMGFFRSIYDTEADLHPILSTSPKTRNMTLNGKDENWLTLKKIDFVTARKLADVKVIDGWVFTPSKIVRPLKDIIERLQEKKILAEGMDKTIIKRLMNGTWGIMLQVQKAEGSAFAPSFNSAWGAEVENNVHVEVCRFCLDNGIMPLYIMTDGVGTDVDLKIESSKEMGKWKLDAVTPALVMGSGIIALKDKVGKGAFSLHYDSLMETIKAHPEYDTIHIEADGFVSMGEAIENKCIARLGETEVDIRAIKLNSDLKRCYIREPKNFGELITNTYPSIPWDVSMFLGD
jgi:hypothetical protein